MLKFEITQLSFCVPLNDRQWKRLNKIDRRGEEVHQHASESVKALIQAGCEDLEWNGHFGRNFFFSCATEYVEKAKAAVEHFIETYL